MSHGGDVEEPDLVPLLDLVLQLVMFFMMCTNLAMEQFDVEIKLPLAQSATPAKEAEGDFIFLNVNSNGDLLAPGKTISNDEELAAYLKGRYDDAVAKAKKEQPGAEKPDVKAMVVVRADKNAKYGQVYKVMRKCQDVGLRHISLRADIGS